MKENEHDDRAAADRILDDLRHVAYRNGLAAARVFQFLDLDYIDADKDLSSAQDDLHRMARNLPFLREVTAVVEEIESIQDEMSEEAESSSDGGHMLRSGHSRILSGAS